MDEDRIPPPDGEDSFAPDEIVMFFLGPDGEPVVDQPGVARRRTLADVQRAWRSALDVERRNDPLGRNRLGPRAVQGTGRPGRPGYRDEILVTLRTGPERAAAEVVDGDVFALPSGLLEVDAESLSSRRYELAWDAALQVWPWRRRRVQLRLYASQSLNVAVLSLRPPKQRPVAKARFLHVGIEAMNELRDRIDHTTG